MVYMAVGVHCCHTTVTPMIRVQLVKIYQG